MRILANHLNISIHRVAVATFFVGTIVQCDPRTGSDRFKRAAGKAQS
jgi:hypothetical protein